MIRELGSWLGQSTVAAGLVIAVGYLCRNLIETRLARSVGHEFDEKLAKLQHDLEEEAQRRESIRSTGFAALLAQRSALAAKRIEAAEGLWHGVLDSRKGLAVALHLEIMNVEEFVKRSSDPKVRAFLGTIASGEVMSGDYISRINEYSRYQPFVSPAAWALYAVYSTIIVFSISKMKILQLGENPRDLLKDTDWISIAKAALPDEDVRKIGSTTEHGLQWAMKRIEDRIVEELRLSIAGESAGIDSVTEAQRILAAADEAQASAAAGLARAQSAMAIDR